MILFALELILAELVVLGASMPIDPAKTNPTKGPEKT
jgi:hypothetical protein